MSWFQNELFFLELYQTVLGLSIEIPVKEKRKK